MKTVVNKSRKPIRVPLPGGRFLFLGPAKSGQIADQHAGLPAVRKLVDAGTITVTDEAAHPESTGASEEHVHEGTRRRGPSKLIRPAGDR